jgi:hypothetical protein
MQWERMLSKKLTFVQVIKTCLSLHTFEDDPIWWHHDCKCHWQVVVKCCFVHKVFFLFKTIIDVYESMEVNSYKIGLKNLHLSMELKCIVFF